MENRWLKSLGMIALSIGAAAAAIEGVAAVRVRRLRAERANLEDRLYTKVLGRGQPVVFLAGLPATTHFWQGSFDSLSNTHRLIFIDALGFGRSPLPDVEYTLDDHLGALRRTLVAQGATRHVTFVAHSFGTLLATHYAAQHPGEVEHLFLLGTPVFADEREAREHIRVMSSMGGVFTLNPILAREACKLHEATPRRFLARILSRVMTDVPPELSREALLHTWQSFNGTLRNIVLTKPVAVPLSRLGPKVTFVHGRADHITSLERVREMASAIGAQVIETEDDHLTYPTRSAGRVLAVMAAVEAR